MDPAHPEGFDLQLGEAGVDLGPFGPGEVCGGGDAAFQSFRFNRSVGGPGFCVCFRECEDGVGLFGGDRGFPFFEKRDPLDERRLGRQADTGR